MRALLLSVSDISIMRCKASGDASRMRQSKGDHVDCTLIFFRSCQWTRQFHHQHGHTRNKSAHSFGSTRPHSSGYRRKYSWYAVVLGPGVWSA